MPYADGCLCHRIRFVSKYSTSTFCFENQENIPRKGDRVTVYEKEGSPLISGEVIKVEWIYLQSCNDSICTITLDGI